MSDLSDEIEPPLPKTEPGILEKLEAEQPTPDQRRIGKAMRLMMMSYEGPLPPPAVMEAYNQLIPQGAGRLMAVFEAQASHRQYLEKRVVDATCDYSISDLSLPS